ncbi:MAG: LL-diaminopimelate aminotransferase [Candidatus Altiarchaeales archaeon ex4484_2]|nr:MAG: LL-diaminopimelate aminotransferase [Candidatus Altiarchaeales archaeon ex4484_2]
MEYADRINRIPPYLFAEIDREIEKKRGMGMDIINLSVGDPDLPTPGNIIEALNKAARNPENHRYPSYKGTVEFREAVAGWYNKRFNVSLNPENEVITLIGSKEGIAHTPLAFLNRDDVALVPDPSYPVYRISTLLADGKPVLMPLLEENGFIPNLDDIDAETRRKAKLMFLNYPNAPTAATADREFFREVVDFASDSDVIVCHDNPYSEMTFDSYKAMSFLEVKGARDVGIEFNSLSKTFNMTGWRIGMAVGNSEVIAGLGKVKENVDSGAFQAVQAAGVEALKGPMDSVEKNNKIIEERRDYMVESLNNGGWGIKKPSATFYLWFSIPEGYDSSIEFCAHLLNKTGVVLTPGVGFGKQGEGYVRCALTQPIDRLKEAVDRINKADLR